MNMFRTEKNESGADSQLKCSAMLIVMNNLIVCINFVVENNLIGIDYDNM